MNSHDLSSCFSNSQLLANLVSFLSLTMLLPCNFEGNLRPHTILSAQWLRILLPMQETRVGALVWEDPTHHGATKPVRHNY